MKEKTYSILLIKLSAIGDVVHALPLLEVLRKNFPKARIDWLVEEEASSIIEGHRDLNSLIISRRKSWQRRFFRSGGQLSTFKEVGRFLEELRSMEYDLVIDLQGLFKSGILTGLARGRRKIGFTGGREGSVFFLTERPYAVDYNDHALERYLKTAQFLGCHVESWKGDIPLGPSDRQNVDRMIQEQGIQTHRLVVINPVARWRTKLWDHEKFSRLADRLMKELSCDVVFTGSREDGRIIHDIIARMKGKAMDLTGRTTLKELAYLFSRCRLMISTDTGPMHMAAAMGCPVIALFGPTAPERTGPYGTGHRVIQESLSCTPCFKRRCGDMTCMKEITVEKVFDAVQAVLLQGEGGVDIE